VSSVRMVTCTLKKRKLLKDNFALDHQDTKKERLRRQLSGEERGLGTHLEVKKRKKEKGMRGRWAVPKEQKKRRKNPGRKGSLFSALDKRNVHGKKEEKKCLHSSVRE